MQEGARLLRIIFRTVPAFIEDPRHMATTARLACTCRSMREVVARRTADACFVNWNRDWPEVVENDGTHSWRRATYFYRFLRNTWVVVRFTDIGQRFNLLTSVFMALDTDSAVTCLTFITHAAALHFIETNYGSVRFTNKLILARWPAWISYRESVTELRVQFHSVLSAETRCNQVFEWYRHEISNINHWNDERIQAKRQRV